MKVIFLDVDGVLNSDEFLRQPAPTRQTTPAGVISRFSFQDDMLDPSAVRILNGIVENTGAKIVISSTWRKIHDLDDMRQMLHHAGLENPSAIIDATPDLGTQRGQEIQEWLEQNEEASRIGVDAVESFVIIDDDSDMGHLMPKLIKTNPSRGLTTADAVKAINMLNGA